MPKTCTQSNLTVSDGVWLDTRQIHNDRLAKKLSFKLFRIIEKSPVVPPPGAQSLKHTHLVLQSHHIHPSCPAYQSRDRRHLGLQDQEGNQSIICSGRATRAWPYLRAITNCPKLLRCFHEGHPNKPGPTSRSSELEMEIAKDCSVPHQSKRPSPSLPQALYGSSAAGCS